MGGVKQFYSDMFNLINFEPNLLKVDKKYYKGINIYHIGYITIKKKIEDYESIHIVKYSQSIHFCICLLTMKMDMLRKKMKINT